MTNSILQYKQFIILGMLLLIGIISLPTHAKQKGKWQNMDLSIDAVVNSSDINGKIYFFKGPQCMIYDVKTKQKDNRTPQTIKQLWKLPSSFNKGIDAAVRIDNRIYFFKGAFYCVYDLSKRKIPIGFPKPISPDWALPIPFQKDIDAVVNDQNGNLYFLKNNQFVQFDITTKTAQKGHPIQKNLKAWGLPEGFDSKLQAAVKKGQYLYFFKGNEFVRFELMADQSSKNYPVSNQHIAIWGNTGEVITAQSSTFF